MQLSSPNFKKFQKGTFRAQKIKKFHSEKISYILENRTFCPKTKELLYFSLYFSGELVKSEKQLKFLKFF